MFETLFIVLQIIGMISFAMGVWYNFHTRSAKNPSVERVRAFFHNAQKTAGESEILNAGIVGAAIISLVHADYRIFAAVMGFTVVVGAVMVLNRKLGELKDTASKKFARFSF
jgi:nitrate reductase alpha subunit